MAFHDCDLRRSRDLQIAFVDICLTHCHRRHSLHRSATHLKTWMRDFIICNYANQQAPAIHSEQGGFCSRKLSSPIGDLSLSQKFLRLSITFLRCNESISSSMKCWPMQSSPVVCLWVWYHLTFWSSFLKVSTPKGRNDTALFSMMPCFCTSNTVVWETCQPTVVTTYLPSPCVRQDS
jgi:hypothetical protein